MKFKPNTALRLAIVESEQKQCDIAARVEIPETRFSHIVRGRVVPTPEEQDRIAKELKKTREELFAAVAA